MLTALGTVGHSFGFVPPDSFFCPLARSKRPLAKPWLSRHTVAMQKQKKKLFKKFLLTRSQEH